jgi:hypothetical protein
VSTADVFKRTTKRSFSLSRKGTRPGNGEQPRRVICPRGKPLSKNRSQNVFPKCRHFDGVMGMTARSLRQRKTHDCHQAVGQATEADLTYAWHMRQTLSLCPSVRKPESGGFPSPTKKGGKSRSASIRVYLEWAWALVHKTRSNRVGSREIGHLIMRV